MCKFPFYVPKRRGGLIDIKLSNINQLEDLFSLQINSECVICFQINHKTQHLK